MKIFIRDIVLYVFGALMMGLTWLLRIFGMLVLVIIVILVVSYIFDGVAWLVTLLL